MHMRAKNNIGISNLFPSDPLNFLGRGEYRLLRVCEHGYEAWNRSAGKMNIIRMMAGWRVKEADLCAPVYPRHLNFHTLMQLRAQTCLCILVTLAVLQGVGM